jgi:hypothetical protein
MPRKKQNDWLDQEFSGKEDKLPTLRQYLKELPKDVKDIASTVRVIWLPGQWNNYTLQCEHFRVIVNPKHNLYSSLRANLDEFTKGTRTLDVFVTDRAKVSYRLSINDSKTGEWFYIGGTSGLKFTPDKSDDNDSPNDPS